MFFAMKMIAVIKANDGFSTEAVKKPVEKHGERSTNKLKRKNLCWFAQIFVT